MWCVLVLCNLLLICITRKVTAIVPCAENAVDAKAFLPSDIIHSYSGTSIEIIDTDAEGRLVLADGIPI
jgi:leucyl aminopeptidase